MKWEGIILERKEKKEIENRVQDIREKVEMPSFLQRPWVKSKNKTVATDACSQHLLLYSQPQKSIYKVRQYRFNSNKRQMVLEVCRHRQIFEVIQ